MLSKRKLAANRRNAAKSTGPRTVAGKVRARRNAMRHGLAAQMIFDPERAARVAARADEIAGATADFFTRDFACAVAEAELELERIRQVKVALIESAAADPGRPPLAMVATEPSIEEPQLQHRAEAIRQALPQLVGIARYERRAAARRDRAVRELMRRLGG